jgi:hypothetical protein
LPQWRFIAQMEVRKQKLEKTHITPTDANNVLAAGYSWKLGDFHLWLDEDTGEMKVIVYQNKYRITIKPNSDNSCTLVACR